jgi:hypothetical protein
MGGSHIKCRNNIRIRINFRFTNIRKLQGKMITTRKHVDILSILILHYNVLDY